MPLRRLVQSRHQSYSKKNNLSHLPFSFLRSLTFISEGVCHQSSAKEIMMKREVSDDERGSLEKELASHASASGTAKRSNEPATASSNSASRSGDCRHASSSSGEVTIYVDGIPKVAASSSPHVLPDSAFRRDDVLRYIVFNAKVRNARKHVDCIMGEGSLKGKASPNKISACAASAAVIAARLQQIKSDSAMPLELRKLISVASEIRPQLIANLVQRRVIQIRKLETLSRTLSMGAAASGPRTPIFVQQRERNKRVAAFRNISNTLENNARARAPSKTKPLSSIEDIADFDPLAKQHVKRHSVMGDGCQGTPPKKARVSGNIRR